jgi:hypothetical protein
LFVYHVCQLFYFQTCGFCAFELLWLKSTCILEGIIHLFLFLFLLRTCSHNDTSWNKIYTWLIFLQWHLHLGILENFWCNQGAYRLEVSNLMVGYFGDSCWNSKLCISSRQKQDSLWEIVSMATRLPYN